MKIDARGGPGGSWGRSWDHFFPKGVPGTPGDEKVSKKCRKLTSRPPPQGPGWETKFGLFVDFVRLFSNCFLSVVFEGLRVRFYVDLGRFFEGFLNICLLNFDVKRKL